MMGARALLKACHSNCMDRFPQAPLVFTGVPVTVSGGDFIATGKVGFVPGGFAANGFGEHSPGGYALSAVILCEVVMTAMFIAIILGVTHKNAPAGFAPLAIGLALTLIHLISIPVSNTSVNPARSTAAALFAEPWALQQLWVFWVGPVVGGILGAIIHRIISED